MLRVIRFSALILSVFILGGVSAQAQMAKFHRLNLDFGGGFTPTLGRTGNNLSTGWNLTGGGGYNFTNRLGVIFQVMYDRLGVPGSVIKMFSVPGANSHILGFTLDPRLRFRTSHRLGFYIIGGPGYYHRVLNLTQPTTQIVDVFCPYFGYVFPTPIAANQTIGTILRVGWGWNVGAGITYRLGNGGLKLFAEVRYHQISTSPRKTQILPVTFGVRW